MTSGSPPVGADDGVGLGIGLGLDDVGWTIMSGSRPVEPMIGPRMGLSGVGVEDGTGKTTGDDELSGVGSTTGSDGGLDGD
jgi:hypothetical protein